MNATLIRSAYTWIIYELKDCSVALLDAEHRVLGQSAGLPIFLGNLEVCTRVTEEMYGREAWQRGRRLDHERLLPRRHAPERHHGVRADLPRRRADRLRGLARALARRRRQGRRARRWTRPRSTRRASGSGRRKVVEGGRERRTSSTCSGATPLLLPGGRRPERADRVRPDRRAAARGDHRAVRDRDDPRQPAGRDLRPDRAARARRRSARSPTASTRPRVRSTTTACRTRPCWRARHAIEIAGGDMTIDLTGNRRRQRRARSTAARRRRSRPAASPTSCSSPRPADERRLVRDRSTVKVRRGSVARRREPSPCAWYFSPLGLLIDLVVKALVRVSADRRRRASYGDSMVIVMRRRSTSATGGPVLPPRADRRRLGRLGRVRRRERADQQRQRGR